MGRHRKRPWLNPKDESKYEVKEITGFSVDIEGKNWYEVQWVPHKNGRSWRGGNATWQRESVLMADGVRKPIREFWNWLKAKEGKTKQSERERILALNRQVLAAGKQTPAAQENKKLAVAQKKKPIIDRVKAAAGSRTGSVLTRSRSSTAKSASLLTNILMPPEVVEDAEPEEEEDASDTEDDETLADTKKRLLVQPKQYVPEQFKAASVEELTGINQSDTARPVAAESGVTAKTTDDTSSDFSSANSESGLSALDESGCDHHEGAENEGENMINGAVMEDIASTGDNALAEEFIDGSADPKDPGEEMPHRDVQPDMSALEYRGRLTPDFEPSSRRAMEFKLPVAKFTRGVSAFADLRRASRTDYFNGEDDEADEFCREMNATAWQARKGTVSLQDDPDLDDVFTDDENDPRVVQPSFKYDLYAGCTLEQFWATFKANQVEPGSEFDWKAFWEKYCRERGLPMPEFEEAAEADQESVDEDASEGGDDADEEAMESEAEDEYAGVGGLSFADAVAQRNNGHKEFLSDDSETEPETDSASEDGGSEVDE